MLSCQRCKQTTNGPQAFLLSCRGCNKSWHHRCHMPPVEDAELMQRIRATNLGDTEDDLSAWKCRRCKRSVSSTPSVASSREPTVSSESHDDRINTASSYSSTAPSASPPTSVASTADIRVRQEQRDRTPGAAPPPSIPQGTAIDARHLSNREQEPPDDDPEDLYGPPVERRVIRILPFLAEELREQQRRAAAEMERRRAPLAPDWIFARHAHDPLWKEIRPTASGRKRRKPTARRLGDGGLDVSELVGYLTLQSSVRAHKA